MFDGEEVNDMPPAERGIAMVFQSYALYPHMSVYENMAFGLKLAKLGKEGVDERVKQAARILQIEHLLERKPKQLSGGQRQRVAIGRAIVRDPKVFLFDEPLSNLDAALRVQMRIEIAKLHHALDATMIYVTHDQVEAMTLADRIVVLNAGVVEQFGSPLELYHHPQNLFVAGFIGSPKMNLLPGEVAGGTDNAVTVRLADGTHGAGAGRPRRRARGREGHLRRAARAPARGRRRRLPSSRARWSPSSISAARPTSTSSTARAEPLVVKSAGDSKARVDEVLPIGVPASACYLFDSDGQAFARAS